MNSDTQLKPRKTLLDLFHLGGNPTFERFQHALPAIKKAS